MDDTGGGRGRGRGSAFNDDFVIVVLHCIVSVAKNSSTVQPSDKIACIQALTAQILNVHPMYTIAAIVWLRMYRQRCGPAFCIVVFL